MKHPSADGDRYILKRDNLHSARFGVPRSLEVNGRPICCCCCCRRRRRRSGSNCTCGGGDCGCVVPRFENQDEKYDEAHCSAHGSAHTSRSHYIPDITTEGIDSLATSTKMSCLCYENVIHYITSRHLPDIAAFKDAVVKGDF